MVSNEGEDKISFLLSGTCNALPSSYIKLRSYLKIHISNLADQYNLELLKSFRNESKTCPYCFSSWNPNTTSFKLLPSKKSKFSRKSKKEDTNTSQLNESRNTLVFRCKVCTEKCTFSLTKKKPVKVIPNETEASVKKKKKRKKKDKFCGLKVNLKDSEFSAAKSTIRKKKKRQESTEPSKLSKPAEKQLKSTKNISNSVNNNNKKLAPNPFASPFLNKSFNKRDMKLQRLKQAVKADKGSVKKTLLDMLSVI